MLRKTIVSAIVAVASVQAAVTFSAPARSGSAVVVLDRADLLHKQDRDSFMIVSGNVRFLKDGMTMLCDSAHYYPETGSFLAFGNISMEQGDTLFIYADELDYDAPGEVAFLYADPGKKVKMINRDVTLETDVFRYDVAYDIGSYSTGGVLYDSHNRLVSLEGEYLPALKDANFYIDVHLKSLEREDTLDIFTDSLFYNTVTHIARINSPGRIINRRGTIFTSDGLYDTDIDTAALYRRSVVVSDNGRTLTADTIYYNRRDGLGTCFGAMIMTDSARQASLSADYGFFNQLTDSAYATGRLLVKEYGKGDTLYLHARQIDARRLFDTVTIPAIPADTITGTPEIPESFRVDTSHVADLWPRVRFYRSDMQGVCDSMRATSADSTLRMYIHPVVWNAEQQIFGNLIELHFNDSTIDEARLPQYGFISQQIYDTYYNQLAGKQIVARLHDGVLRQLDINGNVEMIMYPEEADSTFNKMVTAQSSFLTARFADNYPEYIRMWPDTPGTATPLFMLRRSQLFLPKFRLFKGIRPLSPSDVMIIPPAMDRLMEEGEDG
ncbi:MAG: hypothetical protein K2M19_01650 [Muribaculaceae bacterium]|nr:hypothetical protein [Muribaculaceae bacterium]